MAEQSRNSEIKAGDVVAPVDGGFLMTVERVNGDRAECVWFAGGVLSRVSVDLSSLARWQRLV